MRLRVRLNALVAAGQLAAGAALPLAAQTRFEVAGTIALYSPAGSYHTGLQCTCLPDSPESLRSGALGGQLRYWFTTSWGLQLAGSVGAPFTFGGGWNPSGYQSPVVTAQVRYVSVEALATVYEHKDLVRAWLGFGGGAVQHYGSAYAQFGYPVSPAIVVGAGATMKVVSGLNFQAGLNSLVYPMHIDVAGTTVVQGLQSDLSFFTGLSWGWH